MKQIKSPFIIYSLAVMWFCVYVLLGYFPHNHPAVEMIVVAIFFWIFNLSILAIGLVWFKERKPITGAIGILLALSMGVMFFILPPG